MQHPTILYGPDSERQPLAPAYAPDRIVGLDLGQAADYSALAIVERHERTAAEPLYHVRHLHRYPLNSAYPAIVADVARLLAKPELGSHPTLVLDGTGVGRAVVDLFRLANLPGSLMPVTIHGGNVVTQDAGYWRVPKRDLVARVQVGLQTQRLKIAPTLQEAATLTTELQAFEVKLSAAGHDSYGAWREGAHDDLVLAVALAVWAGERGKAGVWFA